MASEIEVQAELTVVTRKIGMTLGPRSAAMYKIEVTLDDGERRTFPIPGPHVIACTPGEHRITVAIGDFLGALGPTRHLTAKTIPVTVGPDERVTVRLHGETWRSGTLEIVGRTPI